MNCEECKNQIGAFLDSVLAESVAIQLRVHLATCEGCARVCADTSALMDMGIAEPTSETVTPNSQAMWCRINNILEGEVKHNAALVDPPRGRFWSLSLPQLISAVLCIAVVSSLLTVVAIQNYTQPDVEDFTSRSAATQTTVERVMAKVGLIDTPHQARVKRLREQHAAIDYWNQRVQVRRSEWDKVTRDAFDRNLLIIEDSVNEYSMILETDPEDHLSGEMLDTVLNDKMSLLRDFSDL